MSHEPSQKSPRTLQKFTSFAEQERATFAYWAERTVAERMAATAELVRDGYRMRGIDIDAQRPERSLVRFQRERS